MGRDAAAVGHDVGVLLHVPAALACATLPVAAVSREWHVVPLLVATAAVTGGAGQVLTRRLRHVRAEHRWPAVEVVALGWLLTALAAAFVFFLLGLTAPEGAADVAFRDPSNALFEGMSGITSTGLTIVGGQEAQLTSTAQWWRSLLQWTGGVGMVLFVLGFGENATGTRRLYEAEGRHPDLPGGTAGTVWRTGALYLAMTVVSIGALALTEHDLWTAVNHGLTGISTGGFTITGDSLASFGPTTQMVAMGVIVVGAVAFVAHHVLLVQGDIARWWRLTPVRAQALVLGGGALLLVGVNAVVGPQVPVLDTVFQWVSGAATAGFDTGTPLHAWSSPALSLLIPAMVVGAPSGSTGGGFKLDRAVWLSKEAVREVRGSGDTIHWDGTAVARSKGATMVRHAAILGALWLATLALGTAVVTALTELPLRLVVFDVASALSNVGLDADVVSVELGAPVKATFLVLMYLGRLELLAALLLATQREHA